MLSRDFFASKVWHQLAEKYAETNNIPAPVAEFTLTDEKSFNVKTLRAFRTCVVAEVYGEQDEILLRIIPYENIRYVTLKKEVAGGVQTLDIQTGPLGFKPR